MKKKDLPFNEPFNGQWTHLQGCTISPQPPVQWCHNVTWHHDSILTHDVVMLLPGSPLRENKAGSTPRERTQKWLVESGVSHAFPPVQLLGHLPLRLSPSCPWLCYIYDRASTGKTQSKTHYLTRNKYHSWHYCTFIFIMFLLSLFNKLSYTDSPFANNLLTLENILYFSCRYPSW